MLVVVEDESRFLFKNTFITETCTIPAGSSLVIPIYHIQRDERFWINPNAFDPERFNPDNSKHRHPYSYIPFSLGPMDCLGIFLIFSFFNYCLMLNILPSRSCKDFLSFP